MSAADSLPSEKVLNKLRIELRGDFVTMRYAQFMALVECVERLKLVAAADEKAVRELKEQFGVAVDPGAESFELMDGNKAALAKLEAS